MSAGSLVRTRGYRTLLVGQGVSALGDWMGTVAFMALAYRLTGSPAAVGGILVLRLVPAVIAGPIATRIATRWDRRRTMLAMDATRAVLIIAVPLVRALWWIYLLGFLVELASIVFLPARDSSVPDLVDDPADLPLANGLVLGTSYGSIPLGAALFALVNTLPADSSRPFVVVFLVDAVSYIVSFACIARLRQVGPAAKAAADGRVRDQAAAREPSRFRDAFRIPLVRAVMPALFAVSVGLGALFSLGIVFVRTVLDASDTEFGVLIALFGVGAVIGLVLVQRARGGDLVVRTRHGVVAIGAVVAVFSLAPTFGLACLGAVAFGAGAAYALSAGMGAIQSYLDGHARVLAFTAFHVVLRVGLGVAAVAAGAVADALGEVAGLEPARLVLLASGLLVCASAAFVRVDAHARP